MDKNLIAEAFASGADPDKIQAAVEAENIDLLISLKGVALAAPVVEVSLDISGVSKETLEAIQKYIDERFNPMSAALDKVKQEVLELKTVNEGIVKLVQSQAEQLRTLAANGGASEEELNQVAADLDAEATKLADAVRANTVADPKAPAPDNGIEAAPNVEPAVPPAAEILQPAPVADPAAPVNP